MSNEPKTYLKAVTARIPADDYARIVQAVDTLKDEAGNPYYKDVASFVRVAVGTQLELHKSLNIIDDEYLAIRDSICKVNEERRSRKRKSFWGKMRDIFG